MLEHPPFILRSQNESTRFESPPWVYSISSVENCWAEGFSNQFSDYDSITVKLSVCDILNLPLAVTILSSRLRNKIFLNLRKRKKKKLMRTIQEQLTELKDKLNKCII